MERDAITYEVIVSGLIAAQIEPSLTERNTTMPDHDIIANAYVALWNEADETARMEALDKGWPGTQSIQIR